MNEFPSSLKCYEHKPSILIAPIEVMPLVGWCKRAVGVLNSIANANENQKTRRRQCSPNSLHLSQSQYGFGLVCSSCQ